MDERSIVQQVEPSHTPDVLVVGEEGSAEFPPREEDAEEQEEEEEGKPASDFDGEDSVVIPGCDPRGVQEKGSDADNGCLPSPALGSMRSIGGIPGVNGGTPNRGATPVKGVSVDLALQHRPRGAAKQSDSEGELSAAAAAAAASDAAAAAAAGKPGPKASNTQLISSLIARPAPKRQHALGDPKQQQQQAAAGPAAKKRSSRSLNSKVVPPKTANANISEGMACRPK
ncbi:hypothetical protein DIPPA_05188 [Diplonema papillatum]|nr:hypothetical protein DIPPA_05188 [Diplonema papillatum]KAJ9471429.1 hypothetical protein DIPPA_05188 [Diplonema papillatum]